jgi:rRNA-processing protein FCF1
MKVVYDTNFLMSISELGIDVVEEVNKAANCRVNHYVLESTIKELETFIKSSLLSKRQAAKFAVKYISSKPVDKIKLKSDKKLVDDQLMELDGYYIATMDRELRRWLKDRGTKLVTIRQKRYVVLE